MREPTRLPPLPKPANPKPTEGVALNAKKVVLQPVNSVPIIRAANFNPVVNQGVLLNTVGLHSCSRIPVVSMQSDIPAPNRPVSRVTSNAGRASQLATAASPAQQPQYNFNAGNQSSLLNSWALQSHQVPPVASQLTSSGSATTLSRKK